MPVTKKWGLFVGLGISLILLGFSACIDTVFVTLASTIFIGFVLIVGGAAQLFHAFAVKDWGGFFFSLIAGLLYILAGVFIIQEPVAGATMITLFASACFIVAGITRCIMAVKHRALHGWGIILFSGLISLVVGFCLYFTLPWSGLWLIGTFVAVELIISGMSWLQLGLALRRSQAS
ncbi:HdeD family acid-resistance protein [Acetobacter thailandicus]|uniref:HdeD family acid-resistance protein n=1 Tax=Acetobacter thailandicus TaxID=1502842 RepID=A0ABT3QFH1_9PROT|nr:HdeD family acid-resistance protein [Acetobacter thailandicus]MCX2564029.1 HdeD family acid-resistance protein [Acetobacter thailandicus]NHN96059.1 HdeD family acid-resistance protein [Acetobacter thailandicus]